MLYQSFWLLICRSVPSRSDSVPPVTFASLGGVKTVESPIFSHAAAGGLVAGLDGGDGCGRVGPTDALEVH
jgi:hypothetical protein